MALALTPSAPVPPRRYVLLVSGTMNPPHRGHARLGLHAAETLRAEGHTVAAVCFVPVHDNYLANKARLASKSGGAPTPVFPMAERCAMLQELVGVEGGGAERSLCHVLDYEGQHGRELLAESPAYWAPRLPEGYLRTVPTTALIEHFAAHSPQLRAAGEGARLAAAFGIDNLAAMAAWNSPELLLGSSDLVLVARAVPRVCCGRDPRDFLAAVRHFELRAAVPVSFGGATLFGGERGSFLQQREGEGARDEERRPRLGALFVLPALEGTAEHLSSTALREAVAAALEALARTGREASELQRTAAGRKRQRSAGGAAGGGSAGAAGLGEEEEELERCLRVLEQHGYTEEGTVGALLRGAAGAGGDKAAGAGGGGGGAALERLWEAAEAAGGLAVPEAQKG